MEVKKVLLRSDGIKYVILPKKSKLNAGDNVLIVNLNQENLEFINKITGGKYE